MRLSGPKTGQGQGCAPWPAPARKAAAAMTSAGMHAVPTTMVVAVGLDAAARLLVHRRADPVASDTTAGQQSGLPLSRPSASTCYRPACRVGPVGPSAIRIGCRRTSNDSKEITFRNFSWSGMSRSNLRLWSICGAAPAGHYEQRSAYAPAS